MWSATWDILIELAPWLLLGVVVAGAMHAFVPSGLVARHLRGPRGVVKAVALGVPLPLCSCAVIPAGIGLKRDGASDGAAIGFLVATPQTGVDSMLVSASMLGWPFALAKVVAALVTGLAAGFLVERGSTPPPLPDAARAREGAPGLRAGALHAIDVLRSIWRWLALGVLASALLTLLVPPGALAETFAGSWWLAALAALAVGIPLYVCATGSIPIAAALVAAGMPVGAAMVFLMAGPATNVATIGAVKQAFGARVMLIYLATIAAGSLLFGWLFQQTLGGIGAHAAHAHGAAGAGWFDVLAALVLLSAFAWFAGEELRAWWGRRGASRRPLSDKLELGIDGMTCQNCALGLKRALDKVEGVESAEVDLGPPAESGPTGGRRGRALIAGSATREALEAAVERAGFSVMR